MDLIDQVQQTQANVTCYKHDYIGNIEYQNNQLEAYYTEEGRINYAQSSRHEYNLKDHLGNTRVCFTPNPSNPTNIQPKILQQTNYYAYGLPIGYLSRTYPLSGTASLEQKYQYNGIELTNDFGLMINEARYRTLDPQLGRWWQIDPEVEQFEAWSAYNSNLDNPIRYEDKDGRNPLIPIAVGFVVGLTVDVGFQIGAQVYKGGWNSVSLGNINGKQALISGFSGALTGLGGASVATLGISKGGQFGLKVLNNTGIGTLESVTKQIVTTGDVDAGKTISDVTVSVVTGGYGDAASHNAGEFIGEVGGPKIQATMDATIGTVSKIMENTGQGISDIERERYANTPKTTAPKKPYIPSTYSRTAPKPIPPSQSPQ